MSISLPPETASRARLVVRVDAGTGVLLIPKNASTSLRSRFGGVTADVDAGEWAGGLRVIAFVRDPAARLQSAFRTFLLRGYAGAWERWRALVDAVLAGHGNGHWLPQAHFVRGLGAELVPFERLEARLGGRMPHVRRSLERFEASGYRAAELEEHYREDHELRDLAWRSGRGSDRCSA